MTKDQYYAYLERSFDAFAKTVTKNTSRDILREYKRQVDRETPLEDMTPSDIGKWASITDHYRLYSRAYAVRNCIVHVYDPNIGEVLQYLTPQRREIILLYYFLDMNDTEIGKLLHIDNTTAKNRRQSALKRLKKLMEDVQYE